MSSKPKITGVPGSYRCESPKRHVGYGRTPREAFRNMQEAERRVAMLRRVIGPFLMTR